MIFGNNRTDLHWTLPPTDNLSLLQKPYILGMYKYTGSMYKDQKSKFVELITVVS